MSNKKPVDKKISGFTLLELLIVIGILAILAVAIIWVLNPLEYNRQAKDSNRISDLMVVRGALDLVAFEEKSLGTTNYVSVSIPDTDSTCSNLGLPVLPATWFYRCVTVANLRKVDSNGWIPVDFTKLSIGSPLSTLPIDPVNTTSTGQYYAYITGPSFKITALFESEKLAPYMNKDGGPDPGLYEIGSASKLALANFHRGLVGYWNLDGNTIDSSGYDRNGTSTNATPTTGKIEGALLFNGLNGYVDVGPSDMFDPLTSGTIMAWVKPAFASGDNNFHAWFGAGSGSAGVCEYPFELAVHNGNFEIWAGDVNCSPTLNATVSIPNATQSLWHLLAYTSDTSGNKFYIDGAQASASYLNPVGANVGTQQFFSHTLGGITKYHIGNTVEWDGEVFDGLIDDFRIYNRALSATEIKAIYNATK
ncbi:MAG: LamG-like jellyroll fold domain-containing protein [bacterium]|nr:LamG-like jellyroll fold domain-containing protein [bacterium]